MIFGPSELIGFPLTLAALSLFGAIGVFTDLWRGRIYNWLTLTMLVSGFALGAIQGGWDGLRVAALGAGTGLLVYGWLFALRAMGGGDVKFLMGFGAWGGAAYALETGVLAVILGGAMAFATLLARGRLRIFGRKVWRFFFTALMPELAVELPQADPNLTLPFAVPIALAALWAALGHPLQQLGIWPW